MSTNTATDPFRLAPALPEGEDMEELRDLAQDVLLEARGLEDKVAPETAAAIGDKLRDINCHYSCELHN